MAEDNRSKLRKSISKWANTSHQDARDMRETYRDDSCVSIAEAPDRERVRLRGTLRTVTLSPRGGAPALEAELFDGTGVITVIWLGRRRIGGISPGSSVQIEGRIGVHDKSRVMYNPRYELRS
ncbi:Nucleic acid binding, OB-fold, tRNA/helicase-type [metagenome]|uniref:Nucleic acid binding, OB-fold, tRNA/helicase-type n=1 Tax=metagenome TaxID=256318 RepID=A0A2P2BYE9_9ZZZZ